MELKFNEYKQVLFEHLLSPDYQNGFLNLINQLSQKGYAKHQIYQLFLEFHAAIQIDEQTKNNKISYNQLSDFMDGFTNWGKVQKILPNEPDV